MTANSFIPFQPSQVRAPQFTVQLAGESYTVLVKWNVSAQRYYFDLYGGSGIWIVTLPLVASEPGFTVADIVYQPLLRSITVHLAEPWLFPVSLHEERGHDRFVVWRAPGQIVEWTLEDVEPAVLNGLHRCEMLSRTSFMFYVTGDPTQTLDLRPFTGRGSAHRYINLVKSYVPNATLIFRNNGFEVPGG